MEVLHSLYDALASINVPGDRARAVVRALEADLSANLSTKVDLLMLKQDFQASINEVRGEIQELRNELRGEIQEVRNELRGEIQEVRNEVQEVRNEIQEVRSEVQALRTGTQSEILALRNEMTQLEQRLCSRMDALADRITIRLGVIVCASVGVLFTALQAVAP